MKDTGERLIPTIHKEELMYGEHIIRYELSKQLIKDKTVLDIASGTGYGTQLLGTTAKKVYGVDISNEAVEYAKKNFSRNNISFQQGSADKIPFKDNFFDVVNSFETIEHIPTYKEFVKEAKRVVKKDGFFIVSTPNKKEFIQNAHYHVHEFFEKEFINLLKESFQNVDVYYQDTFKGSSVHSTESFSKTWQKNELVVKSFNYPKEKSIYFIAICSDAKLPKLLDATIIAEPWSDKEFYSNDNKVKSSINKLQNEVSEKEIEIEKLKHELNSIKGSRSWKLTKPLRKAKQIKHRHLKR